LPSIDHLERFADDKDDSEKDEKDVAYDRNPLNIFHGRPNIPPQMYPGKVQLG
jgi:hypothetical protein